MEQITARNEISPLRKGKRERTLLPCHFLRWNGESFQIKVNDKGNKVSIAKVSEEKFRFLFKFLNRSTVDSGRNRWNTLNSQNFSLIDIFSRYARSVIFHQISRNVVLYSAAKFPSLLFTLSLENISWLHNVENILIPISVVRDENATKLSNALGLQSCLLHWNEFAHNKY